MGQSFFTLELDTSPPVLTINAPSYVSPTETVSISINSNENLLQFQSIYIMDSIGVRTDLTFTYLTDHYTGNIDFSTLASGNATLYATLKDGVLNSTTISKVIDITNATELFLTVTEFVTTLSVSDSLTNQINLIESINLPTVQDQLTNSLTITESTMEISLSEVAIWVMLYMKAEIQ